MRTCGLLRELEGSHGGEGGILFKGMRYTLRLVNLESFKELDEMKVFTLAIGHRHLHYLVPCIFINGDTPPLFPFPYVA